MHIPFSTIATTALILTAAEAAPHRGGRHGRPHHRPDGTGAADEFPTLPTNPGFFGPGHGFRNHTGWRGGRGRTRLPGVAFPTGVFPTGFLPTGIFPTGIIPTGSIPTAILPTGEFSTFSEIPTIAPTEAPVISTGTTTPPAIPTPTSIDPIETITFVFPSVDVNAESSTPTLSSPSTDAVSTPSTRITATTTFPSASGSTSLSTPMTIPAGSSFDGEMKRFDRGTPCGGQTEGGDKDAVFLVEEGGTISNVIIGADQSEGIHCLGSCTISNVWWEDVCEDALTIKQTNGTSFVYGGGARNADDKVIQHNGGGTVHVEGFYVKDFGKLYRSCGNCETQHERHVVLEGVVTEGGKSTLVGINTNFGDTATIRDSCLKSTKTVCTEFEGNDSGDEPTKIGTGISASCIYTEADIAAC